MEGASVSSSGRRSRGSLSVSRAARAEHRGLHDTSLNNKVPCVLVLIGD